MISRLIDASMKLKYYAIIFGVTLAGMILLIANPGYFSHDELQRLDYVLRYGLKEFFLAHISVSPGGSFETPARPFCFMIQGVLALFMEKYPVAVHLFAVLTHAVSTCLLFTLLRRFGADTKLAFAAAVVFILSPLSVMATGWSAALMDQWYVLFGLVALLCAERFICRNGNLFWLIGVLCAAALSILSKETAMVLPALMGIIPLLNPAQLRNKRLWTALLAWVLPIALFLLYRLSPLLTALTAAHPAYQVSFGVLAENILLYASYPFLINLTEAGNWVFIDKIWIWAALLAHMGMAALLARFYGLKTVFIYGFYYLLFLAPILLIPMKGSHYLYGSSLAFSVALGALLYQLQRLQCLAKLLGIFVFVWIACHSFYVQTFVYDTGVCMSRAQATIESAYLSAGKPARVNFQAEPGSKEYVLHRIVTGREQIAQNYPVEMRVVPWTESASSDRALSLAMNKECLVFKRVNPLLEEKQDP